ncbi:MAG: type IV pilin-like G/H family protein [Crocosphaera sp.]|nr:type IV pilin-like G/H family protein [Crocosphaera sp.]
MNILKTKLLPTLANKKGNTGFTLIELLVVIIIIGVLGAIALPNILGQVGKARESEAKNTLGAMNRAQQTIFAEQGRFASSLSELEVPIGNEKYYGIFLDAESAGRVGATGITRAQDGTNAIIATEIGEIANGKNGTRDYAAGINYDNTARTFSTVVCRANNNDTVKDNQYALHENVVPEGTNSNVVDPRVGIVNGLLSAGITDDVTLAQCEDNSDTDPTTGTTDEVK